MNADEIVRALREDAEWCDANEYEVPLCMGDNQRAAADLIESLQAENKALREASQKVLEGLQKLDSALDNTTCDGDALKARAEEAERREKAAVENLTKLVTKPITPCHSCSKTCLFPASLAPELQPATWCRDWEWRGRRRADNGTN